MSPLQPSAMAQSSPQTTPVLALPFTISAMSSDLILAPHNPSYLPRCRFLAPCLMQPFIERQYDGTC
jgi:hypothetical protein